MKSRPEKLTVEELTEELKKFLGPRLNYKLHLMLSREKAARKRLDDRDLAREETTSE